MKHISRLLVGLIGTVSVLMALALWFNMEAMLPQMGIAPIGALGRATVRADIAGLFMGIGLMMVMAAWKMSRSWAFGALVLVGSAIAGRLVGVLADGGSPEIWPPIIVEAVAILILLWARSIWRMEYPRAEIA